MAVKLYRCKNRWIKGPHPCWRVEKALIDMGVDYEVVAGPWLRSKRDQLHTETGQKTYPVLVLEDGTVVKEESADLARKIRAGELGTSPPAQ